MWGVWNGITPRDAEALKRLQAVLRYLGGLGLLGSGGWEPHALTAQPEAIYASRFPQPQPTPAAKVRDSPNPRPTLTPNPNPHPSPQPSP